MKNEIKKSELLSWMASSVWKDIPTKSALYNVYYSRIEALLHELDGDVVIKDLDSLEGLTEKEAFYNFVIESTVEELDKRFFAIATEIGTWKKHMAEVIELRGKNAFRKKKGKVGIAVIVALLLAALAAGIILVVTALDDDSAINKIMGAVLTAADILLGIIFFLYEFISDRKEKALGEEIENAKQSGTVDRVINHFHVHIGKQVNKNKGHVINGDQTQYHNHYADRDEK